MRMMLDGRQVGIWTAIPGIINSIDFATMTCVVQPAIQGVVENSAGVAQAVNLPLLLDVPIVFPKGGTFLITMPLAVGDEVLVVFSSRCIDAWFQSGGVQQAMEARMHDLSDGFAIPGPYSVPKIPGGAVSSTEIQIRNAAGTAYVSIAANGAIKLVSATGVNVTGDLNVSGTVTATTDVVGGGKSLKTHTHPVTVPSTPFSGNTGAPT